MNLCVLSLVQLFLPGPIDCSPAGSSRQEAFQARTLEWVAISYSKGIFLTQGPNVHLQRLLEWQADSLHCTRSDQIRSVTQPFPTLCNPMNRSTPGLPVHHQLLEFTETHVHRVSDAIQPSHPLSSPSPLAPNPSQHQSLFQ